jgi:hypothetical protein
MKEKGEETLFLCRCEWKVGSPFGGKKVMCIVNQKGLRPQEKTLVPGDEPNRTEGCCSIFIGALKTTKFLTSSLSSIFILNLSNGEETEIGDGERNS